jgi:hypothetical protein
MRRTEKRRKLSKQLPRTTQIIYGERQALGTALRLLRTTRLPAARRRLEQELLHALIRLRTAELNAINPGWDAKARLASDRRATTARLRNLAARLPQADYYIARLLSDHPNAPADLLTRLARHPYRAVRENVARHPRTPLRTLEALARDGREPLWYLVAFNPGAPEALRARLRARVRQQGLEA